MRRQGIYQHYVVDLWAERWRRCKEALGQAFGRLARGEPAFDASDGISLPAMLFRP